MMESKIFAPTTFTWMVAESGKGERRLARATGTHNHEMICVPDSWLRKKERVDLFLQVWARHEVGLILEKGNARVSNCCHERIFKSARDIGALHVCVPVVPLTRVGTDLPDEPLHRNPGM